MRTNDTGLPQVFFALSACLLLSACEQKEPVLVGSYCSADEQDLSTLQLRADGSFLYQARGGSCWLWADSQGEWSVEKNVLTLLWDSEWVENASEVRCQPPPDQPAGIRIQVLDADSRPISGVLVTINGRGPGLITDSSGVVTAASQRNGGWPANGDWPVDSINIEAPEKKGEGRSSFFSVDCPGSRTFIVLLRQPEKRVVHSLEQYRLQSDALVRVGSDDFSLFARRLRREPD